ncbi:MAG: hypothetical protein JWR84_3726 [Caulobacter sp.]|nr:hypothetical protein [Caulobacter sp.]
MDTPLWSHPVTLADIGRGLKPVELTADAATRVAVARDLGLERLDSLTARVSARPWLDGTEIRGSLSADVTQICSLSGEPFEQTLTSDFTVRAVPAGSDAAPKSESLEVDIDPEGDDPPDVLTADKVDLAAYVVEHLALEVDPFPRKPGAVYEPPVEDNVLSPFAALGKLKPRAE